MTPGCPVCGHSGPAPLMSALSEPWNPACPCCGTTEQAFRAADSVEQLREAWYKRQLDAQNAQLINAHAVPPAVVGPGPRLPEAPELPELDAEQVIGFRRWKIKDWKLSAFGFRGNPGWEPGWNDAVCYAATDHRHDPGEGVPATRCECGLYGLYYPPWGGRPGDDDAAEPPGGVIYGAVVGDGELCLQATGWRAARAKVVALGYGAEGDWSGAAIGTVKAIAVAYGVPAVPLRELPGVALEHGDPVPDADKPDLEREVAERYGAGARRASEIIAEMCAAYNVAIANIGRAFGELAESMPRATAQIGRVAAEHGYASGGAVDISPPCERHSVAPPRPRPLGPY